MDSKTHELKDVLLGSLQAVTDAMRGATHRQSCHLVATDSPREEVETGQVASAVASSSFTRESGDRPAVTRVVTRIPPRERMVQWRP